MNQPSDLAVLRTTGAFLLLAAAAAAQAQGDVRYVSDEIAIVLRDAPRADAPARGIVATGAAVTVLEADAPSGYVRVRTADRREGWMLQRHLKREPAARDQLQRLEKELAGAQAELKKVREENARLLQDFARITAGEPIASRELVAEAERLRAELARRDEDAAGLREQYDLERARQRLLLIGGALVVAGFLLALLLRLVWPKRRWGDF